MDKRAVRPVEGIEISFDRVGGINILFDRGHRSRRFYTPTVASLLRVETMINDMAMWRGLDADCPVQLVLSTASVGCRVNPKSYYCRGIEWFVVDEYGILQVELFIREEVVNA